METPLSLTRFLNNRLFAALKETGYDLNNIIEKCQHIAQVEGRMERIDCGQPFNVIVDFAHTPDGMEKMMNLEEA